MIRLTHESGKSIYINPDKIVDIFSTETGHALLLFVMGEGYRVTEPPEEVTRKVLEWRLAMERYRAYVNAAALDEKPQANECWELAANARAELARLAGLEGRNYTNKQYVEASVMKNESY